MRRTAVRRSRREVLRLSAGAAAAALFAACAGDDEQEEAEATPAVSSIPLVRSRATRDGKGTERGGTLRLGVASDEERGAALRRLLYSRLVAVDPRTALLYMDLAEAVELVGPLTAVFTLRPELRFHADAQGLAAALTAEDVRRDYQTRARGGQYFFTEVVERVEAPDPRTVVLRLRGRFSLLFESLADPDTSSVRSVQRYGATGDLLGSGPFIPAVRDRGGDALVRNELFHRAGLPPLDGVAVLLAEDQLALAEAFERGELDLHVHRNASDEPEGEREDAVTLQRPGFSMLGLGLSLLPDKGGRSVRSVAAFQDGRVRRAVSLALDRSAILRQFAGVLSGPVGPAYAADALPATELVAHPLYQHDPGEARALLEAAGESGLALRLMAPDRSRLRALARLLEEQLSAAGFAPRLHLLEAEDWKRAFRAGDFEATVFELDGLRTFDLGLRMHTSVGVEGDFSLWGYSNPVYDAAVRDVFSELDPALRAGRTREAQRLLLEDVPGMLPLTASVEHASIATRVRGYEYDAYGFNDHWLAAQWSVAAGEDG